MVSISHTYSTKAPHAGCTTYPQKIFLFFLGTNRHLTTSDLCKNPSVLELPTPMSQLLPSIAVQAELTAAVRVPMHNTLRSSTANPFNKDKGHGERLLWQSKRHDPIQWTYMRLPPQHTRAVAQQWYYQPRSYNVLGLKTESWLIITHALCVCSNPILRMYDGTYTM